MNYKRLYENLIQNRQSNPVDGYTERHHIIPRSLGGTDEPDNLVDLTAREHFIAHYLLSKMYPEDSFEWHKMNHAFMMMKNNSSNQDRYFNSRLYESARKHFRKVMSKAQAGTQNSQFGTRWIHNVSLKKSIKIPKSEPLPESWSEGRRINFGKRKIEVLREHNQAQRDSRKDFIKQILYYYRDNDITMRELTKKFGVNHNIYVQFRRYFGNEYKKIASDKKASKK